MTAAKARSTWLWALDRRGGADHSQEAGVAVAIGVAQQVLEKKRVIIGSISSAAAATVR